MRDIDNLMSQFDENLFDIQDKYVDNRLREQQQRLEQVVSKFASMLTSRVINVTVETTTEHVPHNQLSASDTENIWFNGNRLGDLADVDTVLAVRGISLREIARILLTPRSGSNLVKWVRNAGYESAFNILENQRVQVLLAAKYSNVKYWFTAAVLKDIIESPQTVPYTHLHNHGKAFLPKELRAALRQQFKWQHLLNDIEQIIDDYVVLNLADSSHIPIAQRLIERLHGLIDNANHSDPNKSDPDKSSDSIRSGWYEVPRANDTTMKSSERSKPMAKAPQQQLVDRVLRERNRQQQQSEQEEQESYDDDSSSTPPEGPVGPGGEPGDEPSDEPGGQPGGEGKPGNGNDGSAPKAGAPNAGASNTIDIAKKHLDGIKQTLNQDIKEFRNQINGDAELTSKTQPTPARSHREQTTSVPVDVVNQVKSFVNQLLLIKSEHDPGWLRKVSTGRLNVYRYMTGSEPDEVFDLWDDGREDVLDIEAVVLLDNSGSMDWTIREAHDSMWAIKRALDKVGASTTVVTFSDDARMLYSSSEKAKVFKKYVGTAGGTDPRQAIAYSKYIFANSERAIKILIVITDGEWWGAEISDEQIAEMRKAGVITALGYIDYTSQWDEVTREARIKAGHKQIINGHNAEIIVPLSGGAGLLTLAKALVRLAIKRNLDK